MVFNGAGSDVLHYCHLYSLFLLSFRHLLEVLQYRVNVGILQLLFFHHTISSFILFTLLLSIPFTFL